MHVAAGGVGRGTVALQDAAGTEDAHADVGDAGVEAERDGFLSLALRLVLQYGAVRRDDDGWPGLRGASLAGSDDRTDGGEYEQDSGDGEELAADLDDSSLRCCS